MDHCVIMPAYLISPNRRSSSIWFPATSQPIKGVSLCAALPCAKHLQAYYLLLSLLCFGMEQVWAGQTVSLATYNLQHYRIQSHEGYQPKSPRSREVIHQSLLSLQADVVLLQELGSHQALEALSSQLTDQGLYYPFRVFLETPGSPIHLGLLSQFKPIRVRHHHTNVFVLYGRGFKPSRGFMEVDLALKQGKQLKLWGAHLKSKRQVNYADQWDLRTSEAMLLKSLMEQAHQKHPDAWMVLLGDLNDDPKSRTLSCLLGRGRYALKDTRPIEGVPGQAHGWSKSQGRIHAAWTHFFQSEDSHSRLDYILVTPSLFRFLCFEKSFVMRSPMWALGSDHRPVMAVFEIP